MTDRTYGHYCGLAAALDLVGERWALLVVRELLFGPQRYSDLLERLPGISTNVLADRIRDLERAAVLRRRRLPSPAASTVYELTDRGRELQEAVLALGRWGGRALGSPSTDRAFHPAWGLLALVASFRPEDSELAGEFELRIDDWVFTISIEGPRAVPREGPAADPSLTITTDSATFLELGLGAVTPRDAIAEGDLDAQGDVDSVDPFFAAFRFPAADGLAAEPA